MCIYKYHHYDFVDIIIKLNNNTNNNNVYNNAIITIVM